jgi:hypothetical protein
MSLTEVQSSYFKVGYFEVIDALDIAFIKVSYFMPFHLLACVLILGINIFSIKGFCS